MTLEGIKLSLTSADKINLAIAIGTGVAALGSLIAAVISSRSVSKTTSQNERLAREEKDRWLTEILLSLANQCNECIDLKGQIKPGMSNLSRVSTVLISAIDLIHRQKADGNRKEHLRNLWIFLHSSIWDELINYSLLKEWEPDEESGIFFAENVTIYKTLTEQYEKIKIELVSKVN